MRGREKGMRAGRSVIGIIGLILSFSSRVTALKGLLLSNGREIRRERK